MRIILLNPPGPAGRAYVREGRCEQRQSSFGYRMPPVSLYSTAALLSSRGHEATVIDCALDVGERALLEAAREAELVVIAMATPTLDVDLETARLLGRVSNAHLTAVGVHVTAEPERTLAGSLLDSVVRGEPEAAGADLADALAEGRPLGSVAGLSFREGAAVRHAPDRPFEADLDSWPSPGGAGQADTKYFLPLPRRPYALVLPSRGCPNACTFCAASLYYGKKLRRRSAAAVVDEIEAIVARGVVRDIVMWSDCFTLDREHVLSVCEEIVSRRLEIRWMCNSRTDRFDPELARAMKRSGCTGISFGIESGDQRMLDRMRKGTTTEQGREAVALAREVGIESLAHFILGVPGETPSSAKATIEYAKRIDPDFAQFYCATPVPGTRMTREAMERGWLKRHDWAGRELNLAVIETPWLSASELRSLRRAAYLEFYGRPHVVRRLLETARRSGPAEFARDGLGFVREWVFDGS